MSHALQSLKDESRFPPQLLMSSAFSDLSTTAINSPSSQNLCVLKSIHHRHQFPIFTAISQSIGSCAASQREQREIRSVALITRRRMQGGGQSLLRRNKIGRRCFLEGGLQYFIGVELDGSGHVEQLRYHLSDTTEKQSAKLGPTAASALDQQPAVIKGSS
ncbi:hypothetical protein SSX86_029394 [Deinandra increscens subsp. villosa]|uniref:Uncharacterized protein n=1 Tax=Deinandra increscens subsp. villosa TaxID=3103831 RepID=A0AAP0CGB3_9ASTR